MGKVKHRTTRAERKNTTPLDQRAVALQMRNSERFQRQPKQFRVGSQVAMRMMRERARKAAAGIYDHATETALAFVREMEERAKRHGEKPRG